MKQIKRGKERERKERKYMNLGTFVSPALAFPDTTAVISCF